MIIKKKNKIKNYLFSKIIKNGIKNNFLKNNHNFII